MRRYGAVFSPAVLLPRNPKSNGTMSCPFSCASSVRFRQCGSSFARDATQAKHQARNGMWVAECSSLSNSLGSVGAFFTRASRPSSLTSMSAAFTGLTTSAIGGRRCGDSTVSDNVTRLTVDYVAAHLTICIQYVPDRRRSSTETPSPLLFVPVKHACCPKSAMNPCSVSFATHSTGYMTSVPTNFT